MSFKGIRYFHISRHSLASSVQDKQRLTEASASKEAAFLFENLLASDLQKPKASAYLRPKLAGTENHQAGNGTKRSDLLHRLMGGAILTDASLEHSRITTECGLKRSCEVQVESISHKHPRNLNFQEISGTSLFLYSS